MYAYTLFFHRQPKDIRIRIRIRISYHIECRESNPKQKKQSLRCKHYRSRLLKRNCDAKTQARVEELDIVEAQYPNALRRQKTKRLCENRNWKSVGQGSIVRCR
jgi:hypothetical protein